MGWLEDALAQLRADPSITAPPDLADMSGSSPQFITSPFGPVPSLPPAAPPTMADQQPVGGLNSPIGGAGGGGLPFSMAGPSLPPSVQTAQAITAAPPPPAGPPPGDVPMPVPRPPGAPAAADGEGDDETPANATPTAGTAPGGPPAAPAAPPDAPFSLGGAMSSIGGALKGISPALLGVGGALSGDMGATTRAILKERDDKEKDAQTANLTASALLKAGAPADVVAASIKNPTIMKATVDQYLGKSKYKLETIKEDEFGGKQKAFVNENDPTDIRTVDGKKLSPDTATESANPSAYLAKGVTAVDHNLTGDAYLAQYSPEMQQAVHDYADGKTLPSGRKGWPENVKKVAQKWGADTGREVTDQAYYAKKNFVNSLGNTNSGVGMQAKGFQQGLEHMANLSDDWVKAKQAGGFGIEPIANWENYFRGLTSKQRDIYNSIGQHASTASGEIGKLFSGSQGGGVHEREQNASRLGNTQQSGPAAAGSLEAALNDMGGGLRPLETRRDELFQGKHPAIAEFEGPAEKANIAKIRANIAVLRGEQPPQGAIATAPLKPGKYVWNPQTGLVPQ